MSDPETVPDQFRSPVPEPPTCILPLAPPHNEGLVTVPAVITGAAFTVTVVPADAAELQLPVVTETV